MNCKIAVLTLLLLTSVTPTHAVRWSSVGSGMAQTTKILLGIGTIYLCCMKNNKNSYYSAAYDRSSPTIKDHIDYLEITGAVSGAVLVLSGFKGFWNLFRSKQNSSEQANV